MNSPHYRTPEGERAAMAAYERALEQWPVPTEQRTVATRHGETFMLSFGEESSPPLVLLHGAVANSSTWAAAAPRFAESFRVYAVDLPGDAGKSTPNRPPYAGRTYADWLGDVFDGLGIERARLAGLSLGGWASLKFASTSPHRVERVALIATGGVVPAKKSFIAQAVLCQFLGERGIERMARLVFSPQPPPAGVSDAFKMMNKHFKPRREGPKPLTDAELRNVTMPVFLLGGANDALLDMHATNRRLASLLPRFSSVILPDAGHAVLQPGDRVLSFLRATDDAPAK